MISGLLFLLSIASGFWLGAGGKPYSTLILTIHKLISLGTFVYLSVAIFRLHKLAPLPAGQLAAVALMVVLFLGLVATGGMLSMGKEFPVLVLKLHRIAPWLTLLTTGAVVYLLFDK